MEILGDYRGGLWVLFHRCSQNHPKVPKNPIVVLLILGFGDPTKGMTRIWGHFVILVECECVTFKPQIMLKLKRCLSAVIYFWERNFTSYYITYAWGLGRV